MKQALSHQAGFHRGTLPSPGQRGTGRSTPRSRLKILTFTEAFPNREQPLHGLFVRERVRAIGRLCDLRVMAPVPWAPSVRWLGDRYYRYSQVPWGECQEGLAVTHPRFFRLPKLLKAADGLFMAVSSLAPVIALRRTFPFDVLDAHWAYPDGVAAAIIGRVFRVPLALTVRGDDINVFPQYSLRRPWIRWALKTADLVIALSEELRSRVERLGVPSPRVVVIPNGVDPDRFRPVDRLVARRRLGLPEDGEIVLSVGRLHTSKGHPLLVEALARLQSRFPSLRLVIVGERDHEADAIPIVSTLAAQHGISARVQLVGAQPPAALPDWYGAADLFCLPTSREGSANVLLEALSCGLACITTPVGGNPGIISSDDLGFLVSPEPAALTEAIAEGLCRKWDRERIAASARARTWTVVAEECHHHLAQLVSRVTGEVA